MGMKSTAGSAANMVGPGRVVLLTPYLCSQHIFLISSVLVVLIALVSCAALRAPQQPLLIGQSARSSEA
jgi:hypothetical protein